MKWLDGLFGSVAPQIRDPEQLREALFRAAEQADRGQLERLCRKHRQRVLDHFPRWQKPPDALRGDASALGRYVQGLIAVAEVFNERLGCPDLMARLTGTEDSNPLLRWQDALGEARQRMEELRYREARDLLAGLLPHVRPLRGTGADRYLPITLGYLGECHFQVHEPEQALPYLEEALHLCEANRDSEGVIAYLGNLYEVRRYLGHPEAAAADVERLASALAGEGREAEARRWRRQAQIVRAGEPLNRVVAMLNGVRCEVDEIEAPRGRRVQFVFERNRLTLRPAEELTRRGAELGSQGKYDEALDLFREAAQADPFDPQGRYQEGYTLLHLRRYADAVASYRATEALAPGWFHCRSDLWLAQQLADGDLGHDTGVAALMLGDSPLPPEPRAHLAEQILSCAPELPHACLELGKNLAQLGRRAEAQDAYRRGLARAEEPDIRTRLLVELGALVEDRRQRTTLLWQAKQLNGNLVAAAMAAVLLEEIADED